MGDEEATVGANLEARRGLVAAHDELAKKESPLDNAFLQQDKAFEMLASAISRLEGRLSPILVPSGGTDQAGENRPVPVQSVVVARVESRTEQINMLIQYVNSIRERAEV